MIIKKQYSKSQELKNFFNEYRKNIMNLFVEFMQKNVYIMLKKNLRTMN